MCTEARYFSFFSWGVLAICRSYYSTKNPTSSCFEGIFVSSRTSSASWYLISGRTTLLRQLDGVVNVIVFVFCSRLGTFFSCVRRTGHFIPPRCGLISGWYACFPLELYILINCCTQLVVCFDVVYLM